MRTMILGFTGTSKGMTWKQADAVRYLFVELLVTTLHHGCCIGADATAHRLARQQGALVVGHPPTDAKKMMPLRSGDFDVLHMAKPYLVRNRNIVKEAVDGMIAAPKDYSQPKSLRGEGTWTTIGYAREAKRRLWIVAPDGSWQEQ